MTAETGPPYEVSPRCPGSSALVCTVTGVRYSSDEPRWRSDVGALLDLDFSPHFDLSLIASRKPTMWRYREAIPVDHNENVISFDEGFTPLLPMEFNGRTVQVKQDHLFITGSYKDRGASVLISKVRELGVRHVVEDSSGNAGCAIAAYCARAGIACDIYVPEGTSPAKLSQIRLAGARLHRIPGSREDTARAALQAAHAGYYASHCWNPFFLHGIKTFAYEVCEQLGWRAPDTLVLPAGNGTLVLGSYIGFNELLKVQIITRMPRIIGVQSTACAPLASLIHPDRKCPAQQMKMHTIAEGIAIAEPVRGRQTVDAIQATGGDILTVTDEEIVAALRMVCARGFHIEPTSGAAIAGLLSYLPQASASEEIVTVFTGHGLKSTEKLLDLVP